MVTSDAIFGFGMFIVIGLGIGSVVEEEGGFLNLFDIDDKKRKSVQKFWKKLTGSIFGKNEETNTDTYTQHTPEVIKKDSLSTK
ncbi:hypothetical protein [Companilactobacillus futsaii]|uniref:Uncharacterized protein n=2 Tax=Companilactobacillus futsaii TaxID=938155 RepID=A0A5B7SWE0_9LACO|nr:hypothetical protein [Companilactobacillus futsaii]KRK90434.1 hypothetical protein FC88_GL001856 [Companilactobacillus futsaii JCM 17355]QCX24008.1 hypothetical protein FG051_02310 [Companilactobacillus futsaii]